MRYLMQHCLTRILLLMIFFACAQSLCAQSTQPCEPPNGNIVASPLSGETCFGDSVQLVAPPGFDYQWMLDSAVIDGATARTYYAKQNGQYIVKLSKQNCNGFADNAIQVTINTAVTADVTVVQPTCAVPGGSITVIAGGGSGAGYQYSIDTGTTWVAGNSFNGLQPGEYNIMVRDGSQCTSAGERVTITEAVSPIAVNITTVDAGCLLPTGSVTAVASGGASPYTYELSGRPSQGTGVFLLVAGGDYTLTVRDANGCTKTENVTVNQFLNTITATVATTNIDCVNPTGSVTVSASGGLLFTYRLDDGEYGSNPQFTGLTAGAHTITVREGVRGCVRTVGFEITDLTKTVTATIASKTDVSCAGGNTGAVTITPAGGTEPYTYRLNTGEFGNSPTFENLAAGDYTITVRDAGGCTAEIEVTIEQAENTVTASIASTTDVSCAGGNTGSVTVAPGGGTAPYTYRLGAGEFVNSPTFENLAAGDYTITVRDAAGCTAEVEVTIEQLANTVTATIASKTDVSCAGGNTGAVTVTPGGGAAPYTYRLGTGEFVNTPTFENLAAGDYTITVRDAAGCTADVEVTIEQLANTVTATIASKTDVSCAGGNTGAVTVTPGGGTAPYTYRISTGEFVNTPTFENLAAGDYTITVRDAAGCTADVEVTIEQLANTVTATVASKTDVSCAGGNTGSVTVTSGGGAAPYTYRLGTGAFVNTPAFENLAAGDYTITVRDAAGCTADVEVTIEQLANTVTATIASKTDVACGGNTGSVTITPGGGTAPYTYRIGTGEFGNAATFNNLAAGDYTITVRDAAGCTAEVEVTIEQLANTVTATIASKTDVACGGNTGSVIVTPGGGTAPYTYRIGTGEFGNAATFNNLAAGDYTITVRDAAGCTAEVEVTIEQLANTVTATVASKTDVSCAGGNTGSVTVTPGGGTAPYTLRIGTGEFGNAAAFNNLAAGDYTITVRDAAGCTAEVEVTIEQLANTVTATVASKTDVFCAGNTGAVTVTAAGGTAPYTYQLGSGTAQPSNAFTDLAPGDYVITVRDAAGCSNTVAVTIIQQSNTITASIAAKTDIGCAGGNTGSATITATGGTAPYTYKIGPGEFTSSPNFTGLSAGNYVITVRDANGCTRDVNLTINQLPNNIVASISSRNDVGCSGAATGSFSVSASGGTEPYTYKLGAGNYGTSSTFSNLLPGDYVATIRDANGCTRDISVSIVQLANTVTATLSNKTDASCGGGNTGSITVAGGGGTAPYTYKLGAGNYQQSGTFTALAPGSYTVTVRDAGGCTSDLAVVISQATNTIVAAIASQTDVPCSGGNSGSVTITASGGTAPFEYKLNNGNFQSSPTFQGLPAGNHIVTVRDATGCTKDVPVTIGQLNNTVTATLVSKADISCFGGSIGSMTVAGGGGTAPYQYKLGTGNYQATGTFFVLGVGVYTVTVKDAVGCTRDIEVVISQINNTVTAAVASQTDVPCAGGNVGSVTIAAGGGRAPYEYRLSTGMYQSSPTFNNLAPGSYNIIVRDAGGCTRDVSVNIGILPNTIAPTLVSKKDISCGGGNTGSVTVSATGGTAPYQFKIGSGEFGTSTTFENLPAGDQIVTVKDATGCTRELVVNIAQLPNTISGAISARTNISCAGGNTGSVTIAASGGTAPYQYKLGNNPYNSNATFDKLGAGNYTITIRDAAGCTKDVPVVIEQLPNTLQAAVSSQVNIPCSGNTPGSVIIAASGGTMPYQYSVDAGPYQSSGLITNLSPGNHTVTVRDAGGCTRDVAVNIAQSSNTITAVVDKKTDVSCGGGNTGAITIKATGGTAPYEYRIDNNSYQSSPDFEKVGAGDHTITVRDAGGCTQSITVNIGQSSNTLNLTLDSKTDIGCAGGTKGSITVKATGGSGTYEYKINNGDYRAGSTFQDLEAGEYTITVKDEGGCTKDITVTINRSNATPGSIAPAMVDPICTGSSQVLTASDGISYQWYRNDVIITGATEKTYTATTPGRYTVEINDGTCTVKASTAVQLTFQPCQSTEIFVPTAFTPNGNNTNDKLMPMFVNVTQLKYFRVYNRWGQLVYQTSTVGEGWDGVFKGVRQAMETFSWVLECVDNNGKTHKRSGKSILIR